MDNTDDNSAESCKIQLLAPHGAVTLEQTDKKTLSMAALKPEGHLIVKGLM